MKEKPTIIDDGTLDTVVLYNGIEYRYSSEYRFSFENDEEFLSDILEELKWWIQEMEEQFNWTIFLEKK